MERVIDLQEEVTGHFPASAITDAEAHEIDRSAKFELELPGSLNGRTWGIRSKGTVGHIPVGASLLVRVMPKVPVANLFAMLEVAYNLPSFRILDGKTDITSIEDIYERVVSILCKKILDRARRGLYRAYVEHKDELTFLRGRLDPVAAMLNVKRGVPRIPCCYEEQTADLEDNQILLWTLRQVRRPALQQKSVRRELDLARRALEGTIGVQEYSARDCVHRFYHRLNEEYGNMHGLCRFILEQSGPGIEAGDRTFIPFEVNMPRLFESFVGEWLRQHPPAGLVVQCKRKFPLDEADQLSMEVDILLLDEETRKPVAVLDTKYKTSELPSQTDIYQITYYARELGAKRTFLVYPASVTRSFSMMHAGDIRVETLTFDIGSPVEEAGTEFLENLRAKTQ